MKKEYSQPHFECTVVTMGPILNDSPGGASGPGGSNSGGGNAPARTLYV